MTQDWRCPKCGGHFSSEQSYQNHIPSCGKTYGGSGDLRSGSQEVEKKGGTGSN